MKLIELVPELLNLVRDAQVQARDVLQDHQQVNTDAEATRCDGSDLPQLLGDLDAAAVDGAGEDARAVQGGDA